MGLKDAKEGKLLYHLTELKNLEIGRASCRERV